MWPWFSYLNSLTLLFNLYVPLLFVLLYLCLTPLRWVSSSLFLIERYHIISNQFCLPLEPSDFLPNLQCEASCLDCLIKKQTLPSHMRNLSSQELKYLIYSSDDTIKTTLSLKQKKNSQDSNTQLSSMAMVKSPLLYKEDNKDIWSVLMKFKANKSKVPRVGLDT